jgi:hypothetical protein
MRPAQVIAPRGVVPDAGAVLAALGAVRHVQLGVLGDSYNLRESNSRRKHVQRTSTQIAESPRAARHPA